LPAAAAVEVYHTWGLVHDDIIDMDDLRRGGPTVHKLFSQISSDEWGYDQKEASRYGLAIAILAGDALMAWSVSLLSEMFRNPLISQDVTQYLIEEYANKFIPTIIEGETKDVQYEKVPIDKITENDLLDISYKKTGNIYTLAGLAGAIIGLNKPDPDNEFVLALTTFTTNCGLAFQLIDDVLNLVGEVQNTGKAVGSDIRIGKRTIPIIHAIRQVKGKEKALLLDSFGNLSANSSEIIEAIEIIEKVGGIAYTRELASNLVQEAFSKLGLLPETSYKKFLEMWGRRIVDRKV
jgi:geranylgeranyl diphosphate synthase type I